MLIINYDIMNGDVVPDGVLLAWWENEFIKSYDKSTDHVVTIGSESMLMSLRVSMKRNKIDPSTVIINSFRGEQITNVITIDNNIQFSEYTDEMDTMYKYLSEIIG